MRGGGRKSQVRELGAHRQLGGGPQGWVDVGVHGADDGAGRGGAGGHRGPHLHEPCEPVLQGQEPLLVVGAMAGG